MYCARGRSEHTSHDQKITFRGGLNISRVGGKNNQSPAAPAVSSSLVSSYSNFRSVVLAVLRLRRSRDSSGHPRIGSSCPRQLSFPPAILMKRVWMLLSDVSYKLRSLLCLHKSVCFRSSMGYSPHSPHRPHEDHHHQHLISKTETYLHVGQALLGHHARRTFLETKASSPPASQASFVSHSWLSPLGPNVAGHPDLVRLRSGETSLLNESSQKGTDTPYLVEPEVCSVPEDETVDRPGCTR